MSPKMGLYWPEILAVNRVSHLTLMEICLGTLRRILYLPRILSPDAPINSEGSQDGVARVTLVVWVCEYLLQNDRYTQLDEFPCNGRFVKDTHTPKPQV